MLLAFRVTNHRSIRAEQELSFLATELNEGSAVEIATKPSGTTRVLPVIGIYGPNASGKSNVLDSLIELAFNARRPPLAGDDGRLWWSPHLLDETTRMSATRQEVDFLIDGTRYSYGIAFTADVVQAEWLYAYPNGKRQVWFEREAGLPERLRFPGNHLGPTESALAELARPDRPFLALAGGVRHEKLNPITEWFAGIIPGRSHSFGLGESLVPLFSGADRELIDELLRRADHGIEGSEIAKVTNELFPNRTVEAVRLRHRGRSSASALPIDLESAGTKAWLGILLRALPALRRGGVMIIDEIEESLHPELVAETIRMFYDRRLNRHGAQLLFSSHDASLLSPVYGRPLLDRDQVWFTEKGDDGATELFPLADLKPRKGENLERGYLSGRYGAVPGLSPGELARTLWPEEGDST